MPVPLAFVADRPTLIAARHRAGVPEIRPVDAATLTARRQAVIAPKHGGLQLLLRRSDSEKPYPFRRRWPSAGLVMTGAAATTVILSEVRAGARDEFVADNVDGERPGHGR